MPDSDRPDQEPSETAAVVPETGAKSRRSFSNLRRELTDEELGAPAVQRLLLDDLDRLERDVTEQSQYRTRFHEADKRASVLEEKLKRWGATEIVHGLCLTAGSVLIGYAPAVWNSGHVGYVLLAIGSTLVVGGVIAKARQK